VNLLGLIGISLALGVLAWLAFLWSVRSGQYDDPEGPKYRMLDDEEDAPPHARPDGPAPDAAPPADPGAEPVRGTSQGQTPGRP
jgi:cbb3-type cytochrome oxidase maturation protein